MRSAPDCSGQMEPLAHLRHVAHGRDEPRRQVVRVRRGEADAREPVDVVHGLEQRRQIGGGRQVTAVGVHRLPEQGDLAAAFRHELAHLADDRRGRVAALAAARGGHHAEGAVLLAPFHHGDVRLEARRAGGLRGDLHERAFAGLEHGPALAPHFLDELPHPRDRGGAEHEIDLRRAPLDLGLVELRHASHDAHHQPRPLALELGELAELREHLVLRLFTDRAGVDEDQVGVRLALGELVVVVPEESRDSLRVVFVHLTAVRDEVKFRHSSAAVGVLSRP